MLPTIITTVRHTYQDLRHIPTQALLVVPSIAQCDGTCAASTEYFPGIPRIQYEGPSSRNIFAYRYYNRDEVVYGRPMHEWLRFSLAFWHTMRGDGSDMFGSATRVTE